MKKLILAVLIIVGLAGCQTLDINGNTETTFATALDSYEYFVNNNLVDPLGEVELSKSEVDTILTVLKQVKLSEKELEKYKDDVELVKTNLNAVMSEYLVIRHGYLAVRIIVQSHWQEYSPESRQAFTKFDILNYTLDSKFRILARSIDTRESIDKALEMSSLVAKIILPMVL